MSSTSRHNNAVGRFKLTCETAKARGVLIFTIGFQISEGSLAGAILRECATTLSQYYHVEGADLRDTFSSIASQVGDLRISK